MTTAQKAFYFVWTLIGIWIAATFILFTMVPGARIEWKFDGQVHHIEFHTSRP